jgi:type 2 lantibiotic biosynthesis protein LanM
MSLSRKHRRRCLEFGRYPFADADATQSGKLHDFMDRAAEMEWVAGLAARASSLGERTGGTVITEADPAHSDRRVRRWSEVVARGDDERFAVRLALDGLTPDDAAAIVGRASWIGAAPSWGAFIVDGLACALDPDLEEDPCLEARHGPEIPLQSLTVPFVRVARARVEGDCHVSPSTLGPDVLPVMERQLVAQLGSLASSIADVEFRIWRRGRVDPLEEAIARAGGSPGRELYDEWIAEQRRGGLREIFERYPVLARQMGTLALGWIEATVEFVRRLESDQDALSYAFGGGQPLGRLVKFGGAASDPHRGRRRVVGCTFESGLRLVYKPKSLRSEVVYGTLLEWLNRNGATPPLRILRVLDRGDYGWVELAEQAEVADRQAAQRFYRRSGMVLALLYAVGGKDCHGENLIAAGEHPVMVDAETVLHPALLAPDAVPGAELDALHAAAEQFAASVLGVGMLPDWMIGPDGRSVDISALGSLEIQKGLEPQPRWEQFNTDVARMVLDDVDVGPFANVLRLGGAPQRPEHYLPELSDGFTQAYRILLAGRGQLLAADGPLTGLQDAPVRVLFRPTMLYARAVNAALLPEHMQDGADYSIELEVLGRPLLDGPNPDSFWELHRREQQQIDVTDIPYFAAPGAAGSLQAEDGRPLVSFRDSAVAAARRTLAGLSEDDRLVQLAYLRAAIGTRVPAIAAPGGSNGDARSLTAHGDLVQAALVLGRELEASGIRSGGSVAWVGLGLSDEADRWALRPTAFDMYTGAVGVAIFLAALARVTGEERWRALAMAALSPTLEETERLPARMAVLRGIGGSAGFGGIVYGLVLVAEILGESRPLQAARTLARALPARVVQTDRHLDLLGGSAGALAGLLALDRAIAGNETLELATLAGDVLVREAIELDDGSVMWHTVGNLTLDGFSHGTAGIAVELARLAERTGESRFAALAGRAIRGESTRFDPRLGGWPDRRASGEQAAHTTWCHGSAGIGLARLGVLRTPVGDEHQATVRRDVERAMAGVLASRPGLDHLCCGGAGEAEFLLALGRELGEVEAERIACQRCHEVAERILAGEELHFTRPQSAADVPVPSLFQGTAGVGLTLLRCAAPELPSVLAWG